MGDKKIRLALVGVGNCASSLVEGIEFYKNAEIAEEAGGLMHYEIGGYEPKDIEVVVGFDIDSKKVGKDVSEAIYAAPNCAYKIAEVPYLNAPVLKGLFLMELQIIYNIIMVKIISQSMKIKNLLM